MNVFSAGEKDATLEELQTQYLIKGGLYISGVDKVKSLAQAVAANLSAKTNLTYLAFYWDTFASSNLPSPPDSEGIPFSLRKIEFENYMGVRSLLWMADFRNLIEIQLCHLPRCEILRAFPSLEHLELNNLPSDICKGNWNRVMGTEAHLESQKILIYGSFLIWRNGWLLFL